MKNLGTLFLYEMKKIWMRKLTWVATALLVVVCVVNASLFWWVGRGTNGFQFTYTSEDGTEYSAYLSAYDQSTREGKNGSKLNGQMWDEDFFKVMHRSLPQVGENYFQLNSYLYLVDPTYFAPVEMVWILGLEPDTVTAEEFYQTRRELAHSNLAVQELTAAETSHWEAQAEKIDEPFTYEYCKGAEYAIARLQSVAIILPFGIAAALCGVFSEERRDKTGPILFVASKSRFPLALAKTLAGSLTAGGIAAAAVAATIVTELILLGGKLGFGTPIQLCEPQSGLTLSVGGALLTMSGLMVLYSVLCGGFVMLLSTIGNSTVALAISFLPGLAMIYMMAWGHPTGRWPDWLPYNLISSQSLYNGHMLGPLEIFQSGALLYAVIAIMLLALCWLGWQRWAVAGR